LACYSKNVNILITLSNSISAITSKGLNAIEREYQSMKTLFVADDNELDLRIIRLNLARNPVFGHVLYFNDGKPLWDYIKSNINDAVNLPDVIFLDLNMPEMNGWSILESLKTNYARLPKPISVYIVSTSIDVNERREAMNYHFVKEFISKPLYRDKIISIAKEGEYSQRVY
jgi:CheY-like chemotaxis protein